MFNYFEVIRKKVTQKKNKLWLNRVFKASPTYLKELKKSGVLDIISQTKSQFLSTVDGQTYRGQKYGFGELGINETKLLYTLIRQYKPKTILETGVCNGVSTAIILTALDKNRKGKLISIDFPEIEGVAYKEGDFWEGKGGAAIPKNKQSGWIIPESLKDRWELHLGKSQEILPTLIKKLGEIDMFIHDSEHSYECMSFEYETAFPYLKKGGLLISDDINWNNAFSDFNEKYKLIPYYLTQEIGLVFKD